MFADKPPDLDPFDPFERLLQLVTDLEAVAFKDPKHPNQEITSITRSFLEDLVDVFFLKRAGEGCSYDEMFMTEAIRRLDGYKTREEIEGLMTKFQLHALDFEDANKIIANSPVFQEHQKKLQALEEHYLNPDQSLKHKSIQKRIKKPFKRPPGGDGGYEIN